MSKRAIIRPFTGIVVTVLVGIVAVVSVALLLQAGDTTTALRYGPPFVTAAYLTWLLFWWPMVEVGADALIVRNPLRTFDIDWEAIEEVENQYSLVVKTARRSVTAWAAPAPRRRPTPGFLRVGIEPDRDVHNMGLAGVVRREAAKHHVAGAAAGDIVERWNVLTAVIAVLLIAGSVVAVVGRLPILT